MAEDSPTSMPSAEAEAMMSPTLLELLLPPLVCLAFICGGLILWTQRHRCSTTTTTRKTTDTPYHHNPHHHSHSTPPKPVPKPTSPDPHTTNKIYPSSKQHKHDTFPTDHNNKNNNNNNSNAMIFTLRPKPWHRDPESQSPAGSKEPLSLPPLFQHGDVSLIDELYGRGSTNARELTYILLPVIFTLGFCPLTLLLNRPLVMWLWPPHLFPSPPNINDAIACFLVPAGMVYAISFGFAFQQVAGGFRETEVGVTQQAAQLTRVLNLVKNLAVISPATRLAMIRIIKDVTLTSLSRLLGQHDVSRGDISQGVEDLLRLMFACKTKATGHVKDLDLWQRSVYQRLERLLAGDDFLSYTFSKTRIHPLEWAFLETLGYFTFVGVLLVQTSSYRANLAFCLLTVISISLLCYLVADLDSPFHGFFRVPLDDFRQFSERLENDFNQAAAEAMLEKSFVDLSSVN